LSVSDIHGAGFGDAKAKFRVYLATPPPMDAYHQLTHIQPLQAGDIDQIYRHCGNGWRKIFNVYAKLLFALPSSHFSFAVMASSWQQFRDQQLLHANSGTALCFDSPSLSDDTKTMHLIAGRTLAKQLLAQGLQADLQWLSSEFAVDPVRQLLVTPFFDYRQLNNEKIVVSAKLLQLLSTQVLDINQYAAVVHNLLLPQA
jgi:hypothetical protein